jgi:hypothetical protein
LKRFFVFLRGEKLFSPDLRACNFLSKVVKTHLKNEVVFVGLLIFEFVGGRG